MKWADVIDVASRWPEVSEATSYGTPSLKVRRRLLTRYRPEIDSIVLLGVPHEEREHLIEAHPETFFSEPHYANYDAVLARLANVPADMVACLLERRWRNSASKRAIAEFDP